MVLDFFFLLLFFSSFFSVYFNSFFFRFVLFCFSFLSTLVMILRVCNVCAHMCSCVCVCVYACPYFRSVYTFISISLSLFLFRVFSLSPDSLTQVVPVVSFRKVELLFQFLVNPQVNRRPNTISKEFYRQSSDLTPPPPPPSIIIASALPNLVSLLIFLIRCTILCPV